MKGKTYKAPESLKKKPEEVSKKMAEKLAGGKTKEALKKNKLR